MKGIDRYILRQVLGSMVFVTVALTCAIWLSQSLRLIDLIVNRGVSFTTFLYMSALMLPMFLTIILPLALFAAVTFIYNRLTAESELVVMRSTGMSHLNLAKPTLVLTAGVVALSYGITLYFLPLSYGAFKELQFKIRNDHASVLLQEGVFNTMADGITVYVRARSASGDLQGILIHDSRVPDAPVTMMAESGALVKTDAGPRLVLVNGNRQEVTKENGELSLLYFDRYTLDVTGEGKTLKTRWREPRERFLSELFAPSDDPDDVRNFYKLKAEGHQRLVAPLYALSFTLIGLTVLLSGNFTRRGQVGRILAGIGLVVFVQAAGVGLQNLSAKVPPLVPLMYLNALAPILVGAFLLYRDRHRRPPPLGEEIAATTG